MKRFFNIKILTVIITIVWTVTNAFAQDAFYYHDDSHVDLTVVEGKLVAISPIDAPKSLSAEIFTPVDTILDERTFICTYKYDKSQLSVEQALTLAGQTAENKYSVQPCYWYEGYMELAPTGYVYVKLKQESDIELLKTSATEFKLEILEQDKFMPLWYTLQQSAESTNGTVSVANALYETGLFASSQPSFAFDAYEDENIPAGIEGVITDNDVTVFGANGYIEISGADGGSYEIYSLSGKVLASGTADASTSIPMQRGVYIVSVAGKVYKVVF